MKFVASITQEAQFSLSIINEDTQLVFWTNGQTEHLRLT